MSDPDSIALAPFRPEHLEGVVACAQALEWPSYSEPAAALAAFSSPGSVSYVAADGDRVVGLVHLLTNGVVHSHLSLVGVLPEYRRLGIATRLVVVAFEQSGAKWLDLWSEPGQEEFYRSFHHQQRVGFRIYPKPAV
jgi:ribosomal protein S18 acetylase RimI-like enzyme